jgi:hypothetical protein
LVILVVSFLLAFPPISHIHSCHTPFMLHAQPISSSSTQSSNYTWQRIQVMKLLIMEFCPASLFSRNILSTLFSDPQSVFLPWSQRPNFMPILISSWMKCWFVTVVPRYLNCATLDILNTIILVHLINNVCTHVLDSQ